MPKVSQSYLDARRTQILDAAIVCFARQGFHCATMQDIVKQSRLSPGAIYNYFASKEDIVEAIARDRHDRERRIMMDARKKGTITSALSHLRDAFFGELNNPRGRLRRRVSMQMWIEAQRNPRIMRTVRRGLNGPRKVLRDILADAQRRGEISRTADPDAIARFLIAAFHGLVLQVEWEKQLPLEPHFRLLDAFLESMAPVA
jgi:TetR/AcrR family transcriptional regulator, transcriptional repressor of aconitase